MWLSDQTVAHLRAVADEPDLSATKYRILECIGRGGMAIVYRARDVELERNVAIKVLRAPELDPALAARVRTEARILAGLEHPGIVPVHDVGTLPDGRVWYAMKLVRGEELGRLAAGLDLNERLRIFHRTAEAVAFAHAHGVLHRDLKPGNVMVGAFGEVLVMDWGIARRTAGPEPQRIAGDNARRDPSVTHDTTVSTVADETAHGTRLGTPGSMAPEQEQGDVARINGRTDVYGLGALLGFLAGERADSPPPLPVRAPSRLRAIAAHATAASPADRYASVEQMAEDVRRFQAGLPVLAYRERPHERAARVFAKYRTPILLVLTYLLMRILLIAFARP